MTIVASVTIMSPPPSLSSCPTWSLVHTASPSVAGIHLPSFAFFSNPIFSFSMSEVSSVRWLWSNAMCWSLDQLRLSHRYHVHGKKYLVRHNTKYDMLGTHIKVKKIKRKWLMWYWLMWLFYLFFYFFWFMCVRLNFV